MGAVTQTPRSTPEYSKRAGYIALALFMVLANRLYGVKVSVSTTLPLPLDWTTVSVVLVNSTSVTVGTRGRFFGSLKLPNELSS